MSHSATHETGATVLVVEDNDDIRSDLSELLRADGFAVVEAADGAAALALLVANGRPPSAIVLDLMMPVMDGWQLRAVLLADPRWAKVPVVVVSGGALGQAQAADLQAVAYFPKPFDVDSVLNVLRGCCTG